MKKSAGSLRITSKMFIQKKLHTNTTYWLVKWSRLHNTHIDSVSDSSKYYVMDGTFKESVQKAHANCHLIFIGLREKLAIFLPQIASEFARKRNCISTRCCIIPSCAIKITGNYRVHACHLYRFLYLSSPFTHSVQHSES